MLIITDPTFHYATSTGALRQELSFAATCLRAALETHKGGGPLRETVAFTLRSIQRELAAQAERDKAYDARLARGRDDVLASVPAPAMAAEPVS